MTALRCEFHASFSMTYPPPRCPNKATVLVSGFYVNRELACCDDCRNLIAWGTAITSTPIPSPAHDWRHEDAPIGQVPDIVCARCRLTLTARVDLIDGAPVARLYTPSNALHDGEPWTPSGCCTDVSDQDTGDKQL